MGELQLVGVEKLARGCVTGQFLQARRLPVAVNVVPCNWKTKMLEVHTNLMRAPRVQNHFGQSSSVEALDHTVSGARLASLIVSDRHSFAMRGMPRDGRANLPAGPRHLSTDDREVDFLQRPLRKLFRQGLMCWIIFRHNQAAARVLIEPMHDPGPRHAADSAKLPFAMMEQRIDQRMFLIARSRPSDTEMWRSMTPLARDPSRRSTKPVMPAMHLVGPYLPEALIAATPVMNSVSPSDFSSSGPSARYISRACSYIVATMF